jgi:hypothetical protein
VTDRNEKASTIHTIDFSLFFDSRERKTGSGVNLEIVEDLVGC